MHIILELTDNIVTLNYDFKIMSVLTPVICH